MQSYQRFHASVIRTSRVSQTPPQTPPYFYQWVSHGKNGLGAIVYKWPTFAFTPESGYTLAFANRIAHKRLHGETGGVSNGGAISTLGPFCTVWKPCAAWCQNGKLCRFWGLVVGAPKERREPSGQRCAYACRCSEGVAAPLGCVICLQLGDVAVFSLCAQHFLKMRGRGGITTLGALCVLLKRRTAACQKGSFAVFSV